MKIRQQPSLRFSIRTKLVAVIALMLMLTLIVNLLIFRQTNKTVSEIDSVFASNVTIQELTDTLEQVQTNVYEYLNTRGSEALEDYYRYADSYRQLLGRLNGSNVDSRVMMLEKNIRSMSDYYLKVADETVQAKRGRNVERYKESYEQETLLYTYINYYIYDLNRLRFEQNSANYTQLLSVMRVLELLSVAVIILIFVISLVMLAMFIRDMIYPLVMLSDAAHQVTEGNFDVEVPKVESRDEIGIVTRTFDQMLESIRAYIVRIRTGLETQARMKERELSMEAHLKEAQLKFLQAQINPHFLFNSLNAGTQLAMMEDADATSTFLEKMADFFRYNVQRSSSDTTLEEEIGMVDNYIYILNVRFAGDITYRKEVQEGLGQVVMPGMILQPLVENAISHGIREMPGQGIITLTVDKTDEFVQVVIGDNGVGMTREQIDRILEKARETGAEGEDADAAGADDAGAVSDAGAADEARDGEDDGKSTSTGIGLENVIRRMQLYYDRDDLINIYSEGAGRGTEVTVFLPLDAEALSLD